MPATVLFEHVKRQVGQRARIFHVRLREIVTVVTDAWPLLNQHRPIDAALQHQHGMACRFSRRGVFLTAAHVAGVPETAAQTHAVLRARSGFDINQLVAEYRALRASELRLWMDGFEAEGHHLDDVIRFNEAIDQAIVESVKSFSTHVDDARNLLLGMLAHDMRSPLQTIRVTASYLAALDAGEKVSGAASRLNRSRMRMQALLDDMVDYNRTRLGLGISIAPARADLAQLFADELDQLRVVHPDRQIDLDLVGDCDGVWDGRRLQQLLGNLVLNAIKYGAQDASVRVTVASTDAELLLEVGNVGDAIEHSTLDRIFDPLQRGPNHPGRCQR